MLNTTVALLLSQSRGMLWANTVWSDHILILEGINRLSSLCVKSYTTNKSIRIRLERVAQYELAHLTMQMNVKHNTVPFEIDINEVLSACHTVNRKFHLYRKCEEKISINAQKMLLNNWMQNVNSFWNKTSNCSRYNLYSVRLVTQYKKKCQFPRTILHPNSYISKLQ